MNAVRRLGAAAVVVLAGAVPAAAGSPTPELRPAADERPTREEAVRALLDQRERALREGDRVAFLDTVDPRADEAFRLRQARLFDGLRSLPLAAFGLELRTDEVPDLSTGLEQRYAAEEVFLPATEASYRIADADLRDAVDTFWYTFVRRDGRWRIASDTDVEDLGLPTARNLWDFGPVALERSDHFAILFDPADRARAQALLAMAEEGYRRLGLGGFHQPLPTRTVIVLPHTLDQLRDILQATFDLTNFVAFAAAAVDRDEGWETTSSRVYVQDRNLNRHPRSFQLETFHHEMVHVAAFPLAGPFVPAWVHEGVADWLSTGQGRPEAVPGSDKVLPEDYEFTTGGAEAILRSYNESTSAIAFLARAKGERSPLDLLIEAGRTRIAPGTQDYHTDQAFRRVYGQPFDEFQRTWNGGG